MTEIVVTIFFLGYLAIVFEHRFRVNKTAVALAMAGLSWISIATFQIPLEASKSLEDFYELMNHHLFHHLGETAQIAIFLMGAMVIVETIDLHRGFDPIKTFIKTRNKKKLLWIFSALAFILSAIIDNLTATIVLISILRKLVPDEKLRWWYAGMVVVSANAGGAWSPIGDVTTTMLWMAHKVSFIKLSEMVLLPSILCALLPILLVIKLGPFRGNLPKLELTEDSKLLSSKFIFFIGIGLIISVPVFKTLLHIPPYMGMIFSLGVFWLLAEWIKPTREYTEEIRQQFLVHKVLSKIDMSTVLFFVGIIMAVGALQSTGELYHASEFLKSNIPSPEVLASIMGAASAVVDNVPLVAASIGMFPEPMDHEMWHLIAYACGTGGSMLIIGSAAGIAAMGLEKITFEWYFQRITLLAFVGFVTGIACFYFFHLLNFY